MLLPKVGLFRTYFESCPHRPWISGNATAMESLREQLNTGNPRYYIELLDLLRVCATDNAEAVVVTDSNDVTQTTVETRRKDGRVGRVCIGEV